MVHPQPDQNDVLQQGRVADKGPEDDVGRLPYAGEIIGRKDPPYQATGLDALAPLLGHVEFPATKQDIIARIGQAAIPVDKMRTARVAGLIERVAPERFESRDDFIAAFKRIFHEQGLGERRGGHQRQSDDVNGMP